jgi:hypothetical protein
VAAPGLIVDGSSSTLTGPDKARKPAHEQTAAFQPAGQSMFRQNGPATISYAGAGHFAAVPVTREHCPKVHRLMK